MNEKTSATFRKLERKCASRIVAIHGNAFDEDVIRYSIFASPKIALYIAWLIDEPEHEFTGAYIDDELAGYAHIRLIDGQPHLNYIAVKKDRQSSGTGSELISYLLERARSKDYLQFTLDVPESSDRVRRWYESTGFKEESRSYIYIANKTNSKLPGREEVGISYDDHQSSRFNKFGIANCEIDQAGAQHTVGVIGENLFRVGVGHDQPLLSALQVLDPNREIMIIVPSKADLNGSARLVDTSIRMVRAL